MTRRALAALRAEKRADFGAPMICGADTMEPTQSMADGQMYTSKSAIRRSYRANGNPQGIEYTEVGNDPARKRMTRPQPKSDPQEVREAIDKAIARHSNGERPATHSD